MAEIHSVTVEESGDGVFLQKVAAGRHSLVMDEPEALGGNDRGPNPYELLLAALGGCTAMTLRMYARQKGWPLEKVSVVLSHQKGPDRRDLITRQIKMLGPLDETQRLRLLEIAEKCPVHRSLTGELRPVVETMFLP